MGYFMETGKVKFFNDKKGFGFITMDNGREVFVHQSSIIAKGYRTLKETTLSNSKFNQTCAETKPLMLN